jgi:hypothetical protein
VQRIGAAGVLGQRPVVEIRDPVFIQNHVLQHRSEALGGAEDFRLGFARQPDGLGVAAALEIEHAVFAPAMLVVADQRAFRIGRKRCLAGSRKAEEHGGVAIGPDIGRAMHRHDALGGKQVVERGEHRLLHFAGIGSAADQNQSALRSTAITVSVRQP